MYDRVWIYIGVEVVYFYGVSAYLYRFFVKRVEHGDILKTGNFTAQIHFLTHGCQNEFVDFLVLLIYLSHHGGLNSRGLVFWWHWDRQVFFDVAFQLAHYI